MSSNKFRRELNIAFSRFGSTPENNFLQVSGTPLPLVNLGLPQKKLYFPERHVYTCTHKKEPGKSSYHGISKSIFYSLPELLSKPVLIFESPKTSSNPEATLLMLNGVDPDKLPIIAAIYSIENEIEHFGNMETGSLILSVYGRNRYNTYLQKSINEDRMLYVNEKRMEALSGKLQLQLPPALRELPMDRIIHYPRNIASDKIAAKEVTNERIIIPPTRPLKVASDPPSNTPPLQQDDPFDIFSQGAMLQDLADQANRANEQPNREIDSPQRDL